MGCHGGFGGLTAIFTTRPVLVRLLRQPSTDVLLNIDFALLLSYWKKRMSTTLQVYTAKFILEASVSKRNPQRRQDIMDSALLETYHVRAAQ